MLIIRSGKRQIMDGIELPNQKKKKNHNTRRKGNTIKQVEMK